MNMPLRHSHIAILDSVANLASRVGAPVLAGEDDLGAYHYFDLSLSEDLVFRFASHDGDRYVHLLANVQTSLEALAQALTQVGVTQASTLSISTDQNDQPLLDRDAVNAKLIQQATDHVPVKRLRTR